MLIPAKSTPRNSLKKEDGSRLWFALGSFCFAKLSKPEALAITRYHLSPYASCVSVKLGGQKLEFDEVMWCHLALSGHHVNMPN